MDLILFYLLVKVKQRGPVFFQALHEVFRQVTYLEIIPATGQSDSLASKGEAGHQGQKQAHPRARRVAQKAPDHGFGS